MPKSHTLFSLTSISRYPPSSSSFIFLSPTSLMDSKTQDANSKCEKRDVTMGSVENRDLISRLPDDILTFILSKLRIDEAVRCNALSKRWVNLWKQASHIEFDVKHMVRPITQLLHSREPHTIPDFIVNSTMHKGICRYGILVSLLIHSHSSDISSCHFSHFRKSLVLGEVESWVEFLIDEKIGLKDLCLECKSDYGESSEKLVSKDEFFKPRFSPGIFGYLDSLELINYTIDCWHAFEDCNNLRNLKLTRVDLDDITLSGILENCVVLENFSLIECTGFERLILMKSKLKVLQLQALCVDEIEIKGNNIEELLLDSIICQAKNVSIYAPSLRTIRSHCYTRFARLSTKEGKSIIKTHEILANCSNLSDHPSHNIFQNLSTLSMDLDLNYIREAVDLSLVLRLCTNLQSLEIALRVFRHQNSSSSSSNGCALSYPISMFWERLELCNCIRQKLKFVYMSGFRGKEQEGEFAKYLITKATKMKKITIVCKDSMDVAKNLLSLPKASSNLSINLKFNTNNPMKQFVVDQNRLLKW